MIVRRASMGLAALVVLAGLAGAVALRAPGAHPAIVNSVPIGNPMWDGMAIDSGLHRAYILDDGVLRQQVTLQNGGGYGWTNSNVNNTVHVIDTRTGRLVTTIGVPTSVNSLAVDAATDRVFAFDQGQVEVIDARGGATLGTAMFNDGSYVTSSSIATALVDERSGHLFAALDPPDSSQPDDQHLLMLDGRTAKTLRNLRFPHGQGNTTRQPNGTMATYYGASLSLALDERAGRLYVFNTNRQISVVDTGSGRRLSTRTLPVSLVGAQADERTGKVFAFGELWVRYKARYGSGAMPRTVGLVMLDPRTGALRTVAPVAGPVFYWPGANDFISVDEDSGRVFALDPMRRAVLVLDGASGRVVRTIVTDGRPTQLALDAPHHRAIVTTFVGYSYATASTHLAVLDTRTGALLRTIALDHPPRYPLAVDSGDGRLVTAYNTLGSGQQDDRYGWIPGWLRPHLPWVPPPPAPPPSLAPNVRIVTHTALTIDPS